MVPRVGDREVTRLLDEAAARQLGLGSCPNAHMRAFADAARSALGDRS
jgi:acyl-CoA hydrolase